MLPVPVGTQQGTTGLSRTDGRLAPFVSGWGGPVVAAGLSLLASLLYAVLGTGYVLDDWFTLRYVQFDGAWAAAGPEQHTARPGAAVVYAVVFGMGQHPLVVLVIQAVIGAATAALLVVVFRAYFPATLALGAALLWVVLPNHTSLEVWASATNIALCVLLAVAATALLRSPQRVVQGLALVLFAAAALCYEAVIPLAAVLILVVPWVRRGRPDWPLVAAGALTQGAVALWIVAHWHPAKHVASGFADLSQVLGAHFGWGIAPDGPVASILLLAGLAGTGVAVARVALPSLRSAAGPGERAVVTGWTVIVLGTIPFAKYLYVPLGRGTGSTSSRPSVARWCGPGWWRWWPAGASPWRWPRWSWWWRPGATPGSNGPCSGIGLVTTPWRSSRACSTRSRTPRG